jgi:preprotein translocase subunit SecA
MRRFGSDKVKTIFEKLNVPEDEPLESKVLTNAIEHAQKKVESENFESRKYVLQYDDVLNTQRKIIYEQRDKVLQNEDIKSNILKMVEDVVNSTVDYFTLDLKNGEESDLKGMIAKFEQIFLPKGFLKEEKIKGITIQELKNMLWDYANKTYEQKEEEFTPEVMREMERVILLRCVDEKWMDHIDSMEHLKEGINLRAYGQHDPVVEYKNEGFRMFDEMISVIQEEVVQYMFHIQVERPVERVQVAQPVATNMEGEEEIKRTPTVNGPKIGRNDLCPCGSGLKYKNCCGK